MCACTQRCSIPELNFIFLHIHDYDVILGWRTGVLLVLIVCIIARHGVHIIAINVKAGLWILKETQRSRVSRVSSHLIKAVL